MPPHDTNVLAVAEVVPPHADPAAALIQVSGPLMILTWVTFLLVALVLYKVAWKPILKALDARERTVRKALEDAALARRELAEVQEKSAKLLAEAHAESRALVESARSTAAETSERHIQEARAQAGDIVQNAQRDIQAAVAKARADLRAEVADLVVTVSGRLLREEMNSEKNRALVQHWVNEA